MTKVHYISSRLAQIPLIPAVVRYNSSMRIYLQQYSPDFAYNSPLQTFLQQSTSDLLLATITEPVFSLCHREQVQTFAQQQGQLHGSQSAISFAFWQIAQTSPPERLGKTSVWTWDIAEQWTQNHWDIRKYIKYNAHIIR